MRKHIVASSVMGLLLIGGVLAVPAQAGSPGAHPFAGFRQFATPVAGYTTHTCVIDLSAIPDHTIMSSITQCGVTITFSVPMQKLTVPGTWSNWGSPPNTETSTPYVLANVDGGGDVTMTFSKKVRRVGIEAEGNAFLTTTLTATFRNGAAATVGTISRSVTTPGGALLFAGGAGKKKSKWVKSLELVNTNTFELGIAQIRVS